MAQLRRRSRLLDEPRGELGAASLWQEALERDVPAELGVMDPKDDALPAASDDLAKGVALMLRESVRGPPLGLRGRHGPRRPWVNPVARPRAFVRAVARRGLVPWFAHGPSLPMSALGPPTRGQRVPRAQRHVCSLTPDALAEVTSKG